MFGAKTHGGLQCSLKESLELVSDFSECSWSLVMGKLRELTDRIMHIQWVGRIHRLVFYFLRQLHAINP